MASACSYAARASAGLPVSLSSIADVVVACRQVALELDNGGVLLRQPLPDRQRLLVRCQGLGRFASCAEQHPDVVVACRQFALELVDGGILPCQPLQIARDSSNACSASSWSPIS